MRVHPFSEAHKRYLAVENDVAIPEKKSRDKFSEIVDAVGIDRALLKGGSEIKDPFKRTIKSSAWAIPEESIDFVVQVVLRYPTNSFQALRQGDFRKVPIADIQFLYDGFTKYLIGREYSDEIIEQQKLKMNRRLHYKIRLSGEALFAALDETKNMAWNYEDSVVNFNHDDMVYFIRYMASKIKSTNDTIADIYSAYTDIRSDELYKMALEDASKESPYESNVHITKEIMLAKDLEADVDYQKLLKEQEALVAQPGFVKKKEALYYKQAEQLRTIRERHQLELFGELLPEEPMSIMTVKHPLEVLAEAVSYEEEALADRISRLVKNASKTPEDIKKEQEANDVIRQMLNDRGYNFDLPDTDEEEEEIFVTSNLAYKTKGMIPFPCCKKEKILVYEGTKGHASSKCPRCGKFAVFDYDGMTAEIAEAARGASHKFRSI